MNRVFKNLKISKGVSKKHLKEALMISHQISQSSAEIGIKENEYDCKSC